MYKIIKILSVILFVSLIISGTSVAEKSNDRVFGVESGSIVAKAQIEQIARRHKSAIQKLKKALKVKGLSPYEESTIHRMIGASHYSLGDNKKAISAFGKAIKSGGLLESEVKTFEANIAQLNILEKNYELGAQQLETYFLGGGARKANLIKLITQAYVNAENYDAAIPWAEIMLKNDIVQTRKEYDTLLFLFDSPEKRVDQMLVANKMLDLWKNDNSLLLKVGLLRGKANKEGVDPVVVTGQSHLVKTLETPIHTDAPDQDAKPIVRVPAILPPDAEKSGHCNFRYDVNKEGRVFNIRTLNCSDSIFEKSALKALKAWRYSPQISKGITVETKDLESRLSFKLRNEHGDLIPE